MTARQCTASSPALCPSRHQKRGATSSPRSLSFGLTEVSGGGPTCARSRAGRARDGIDYNQVPDAVSQVLTGLTDDVRVVMALIAVFVLAAGFFVDATVLIIMLTPIFLPLVRELGGDPVHFGIVFLVAATIGNFTPPVGAVMYAVCSILCVPLGEYTRDSVPLFLTVSAVTLLLILIPEAVLFVPDLLFGP